VNQIVSQFYEKDSYQEPYDLQHGPRLDALVTRYNLREKLAAKRVVDVGGGLGFLGKRLDPSTDYWVIDGAEITLEQRLCAGRWTKVDLDHDVLSNSYSTEIDGALPHPGEFDAGFCLETIEHCGNPHHVLVELKKLVKIGCPIYLSIPSEDVWHNVPYPGLMWPRQNFEQFLGQMALNIVDFSHYQPAGRGWPAYTWLCENRPWAEKKLAFPKGEEKFRNCTPLEATNL
jgi:2-polyprenyl-3-methyl-5-hydroxy-6-metoxy-1,4-benzoquinol methylase